MRVESRVTSLSWIPSEAVTGLMKNAFTTISHYDDPPPAELGDLGEMRDTDRFRFANRLAVWAEFDGRLVVDHGASGGVLMGSSRLGVGPVGTSFAAIALPDLRGEPAVGDGWVRYTQTVGGRAAMPCPRRISSPPFVRLQSPLVWTTLSITLHADGTSESNLDGASPFPRHWVYGDDDTLILKAGTTDYQGWVGQEGRHRTPWGDEDSPVVVTAAETALERQLSTTIMRGGHRPVLRTVPPGEIVVKQGSEERDLLLLLDGVLTVDVDGTPLPELGPGAVIGERAVLEGGRRTATLTASTQVRLAQVPAEHVDRELLARLAEVHKREQA
ncbi:MAG: cyclic nucleotide-binding domain-containing protein [Streptosporangiales bacterium]|nr:cyclic nucleotide-binding domain-containing protein [Streptosporangiales bacterium]